MRMRAVSMSRRWACACLLALVTIALSGVADGQTDRATSNAQTSTHSSFVARLFSVRPGMDDAFLSHLRECCLPEWRRLRADGVASAVSVFELFERGSVIQDSLPWRFLLLAELGPRFTCEGFRAAEESSNCLNPSDSASFNVLLAQCMSCTPFSCHGSLEPSYPDAPAGIDYLVEFIVVEESPSSLSKYRQLMKDYFGPANGLLVRDELMHCFIALETTEILSVVADAPRWNQLHMSNDWDVAGDVNWDSVYTDLFRRELGGELDSLWAELTSIREQPRELTGRLVPSLCVR